MWRRWGVVPACLCICTGELQIQIQLPSTNAGEEAKEEAHGVWWHQRFRFAGCCCLHRGTFCSTQHQHQQLESTICMSTGTFSSVVVVVYIEQGAMVWKEIKFSVFLCFSFICNLQIFACICISIGAAVGTMAMAAVSRRYTHNINNYLLKYKYRP